jgi:multicomponent Na+:H+ antiporter subunit G
VKAHLVSTLLWTSVVLVWLGVLGFSRLRTPLDRLHCVTFINTAAGLVLFLAVLSNDGPSVRVIKFLFLIFSALLGGAVLAHATSRALWLRRGGS